MAGLGAWQFLALVGITLGGDGLATLGGDVLATLGAGASVPFWVGADGVVARAKICARLRSAARCVGGIGGNGVVGCVSAAMRSVAACAARSAGAMVGMEHSWGKNSAVPEMRVPLVSGMKNV